ncbi:metallophosphoesterase [Fredinandcohnia sp. 179-A 10B2 NHS]|uniref:metallophosphoesterase n=1 Tax=Fredinandcohnia sp. 179-A 10B2 NHS TaxID=3235176 RepID=UPI0039A2934E
MIAIFISIIAITVYTIWDNKRIKIVEQEIVIDNLPVELEGYTILQVSDLHEEVFGKSQARLIDKINSVPYDAIVFTGDMLVSKTSKNYSTFYNLLDGIENKEVAYFVPGNTDPQSYYVNKEGQFLKVDFIKEMEKRGVKLLESFQSVEIRNSKVHFVNFEISILNDSYIQSTNKKIESKSLSYTGHLEYYLQLYQKIKAIKYNKDMDVIIALNHYPIVDARIDSIAADSANTLMNYDLIIAGHYHGGQIRLPFIGAVFVPEAWDENNGFFPPQDRVKGLWEYKNIKQYVSAGLGSSNARPYLNFRFLNTPEINVLTLKGK